MNKIKVINTAERFIRKGNLSAAIDKYLEILSQDPHNLTIRNVLGDLYLRLEKTAEATQQFSLLADHYSATGFFHLAIVMLKKIRKLTPEDQNLKKKLAMLYANQGKVKEAAGLYKEIAQFQEKRGYLQEALELYKKAASLALEEVETLINIAHIYTRQGLQGSALEYLLLAAERYLSQGKTDEALNLFIKVLSVDSTNSQALAALIQVYTQKNQLEKAIPWLQKGGEKSFHKPELLLLIGRAYLTSGRIADAERLLLSMAEECPERYDYAFEVGKELLRIGEINRAVDSVRGCLQRVSETAHLHQAIEFFHGVFEVEKNHLEALKSLAHIFRTTGDEYNLMTTLNSLYQAAEEKGEEIEAARAMEEISALLAPQLSPNKTLKATKPVKEIELDLNEVFRTDLASELEVAPRVRPEPFGNCLEVDKTGGGEEVQLSRVELYKACSSIVINLHELLSNGNFDQDEGKRRKAHQAYFGVMDVCATLLSQAMSVDRAALTALQNPFPNLAHQPQEIFKMIELANRQTVSISSNAQEWFGQRPLPLAEVVSGLPERRQSERVALKMPIRVYFKDGRTPVETESLDVSMLGIQFRLQGEVAVGMACRLEMPMPRKLRLYESENRYYKIEAMICRLSRGLENEVLVGAEFGAIL